MNPDAMKPKKVLFVITKGTWGGAQRYVFDLARSLAFTDYQPVVAFGAPGQLSQSLEKVKIRTVPLLSLVRDVLPTADVIGFFEILKCIRKEKPDIVHLNSSKAAALGALAARIAGVPRIVFTVHGWPFKEKKSALTRGIFYALSWLTAFFSHAVIVVSKTDLELGQKMSGISEKIQYIPVGIDVPHFLPKEEALQEIWKVISSEKMPRESMRILTIAELTPNKGIEYALEAMIDLRREASDNFAYVIMGDGEQLKTLQEFVRVHRLDDKVFFLGFVENASVYMNAFDVFLLPSVKEGMPYVLLEAGESGIPMVATDVVNPEIKERYANIQLIHPANGFAIADAVRKVRENRHEVSALPSVPKFALSTMVQQTTELYASK